MKVIVKRRKIPNLTETQLQVMQTMAAAGNSYHEIGKAIGWSHGHVVAEMKRLGIKYLCKKHEVRQSMPNDTPMKRCKGDYKHKNGNPVQYQDAKLRAKAQSYADSWRLWNT